MGPRALTASSGLAPWSMAGSYFNSVKEKSNRSWGSRGLAPLGCLPHWGREGVTLAISSPAQKTRGDFYIAYFSCLYNAKHFFYFRSLKGVFKKNNSLFPQNRHGEFLEFVQTIPRLMAILPSSGPGSANAQRNFFGTGSRKGDKRPTVKNGKTVCSFTI